MEESKEIEGFGEFWKAYPRKRDKIAAMKMFKRALKNSTSAEILRAAKLYASERQGKDEAFTKHPSTWLNAGGHLDYPQAVEIAAPQGFYAAFTSAELDAWNAHGRRTKGINYPQDKAGGWYFPSQWPPGEERVA